MACVVACVVSAIVLSVIQQFSDNLGLSRGFSRKSAGVANSKVNHSPPKEEGTITAINTLHWVAFAYSKNKTSYFLVLQLILNLASDSN